MAGNVPDGYFKGEVRNSFYVESMMKRCWACTIKVLEEVDRICGKYNIEYFADWGTLLGTVRHKGFIPWDDDCDITMKRPDYIRFCQVAPKEFPKEWEILNIHTDNQWRELNTHIVTGRRINVDENHLNDYYGFPYVTGVDIFPLDYLSPNEEEDSYICDMIRVAAAAAATYAQQGATEADKEEAIAGVEQVFKIKINRQGDVVNQFLKLEEKLGTMYRENESNQLAIMADHVSAGDWAVFPKEYFAGSVRMPFEYVTVPVAVGYEKIVEKKYGVSWKQPKIAAANHVYPYYKEQLFSYGEDVQKYVTERVHTWLSLH